MLYLFPKNPRSVLYAEQPRNTKLSLVLTRDIRIQTGFLYSMQFCIRTRLPARNTISSHLHSIQLTSIDLHTTFRRRHLIESHGNIGEINSVFVCMYIYIYTYLKCLKHMSIALTVKPCLGKGYRLDVLD